MLFFPPFWQRAVNFLVFLRCKKRVPHHRKIILANLAKFFPRQTPNARRILDPLGASCSLAIPRGARSPTARKKAKDKFLTEGHKGNEGQKN
jgi:hypothetical protein